MNDKTIINRLRMIAQSAIGITKGEATILFVLIIGGLSGMLIRFFTPINMLSVPVDQGLRDTYRIMDSLIIAEQSTYTGIGDDGKPLADLAKGDTLIKQQSPFPQNAKKELQNGVKIDINTAVKTEIMLLPGIGEATADNIIRYRKENPFRAIEDIMNVKGIGEKKFEKMRKYLSIARSSQSSKH